jgi:hypothetical protein
MNDKSSRPYGKGLEETAAHIALMPRFYDDEPRPVRQHASPPSDHEIRLAFAVMLDMADCIDEVQESLLRRSAYCDAHTPTGRAIQAALVVAQAHQMRMRRLREPEAIAAGIVIELVGNFLAAKRNSTDERSQLRNIASLFSLGGISSYDIAAMLKGDPSNLRRSINGDLAAIEHRFGHFSKNNKALRKTWRLPQTAIPLRYNNYQDRKSPFGLPATAFDAGIIDSDFDADELSETISRILFDD